VFGDNAVHRSKLVVYAIADIPIGEEMAISYVEDPLWDRPHMHIVLHAQHGFQCRDCPRCRDPTHSHMLLDHELGIQGKPTHLFEQLGSLETAMAIESHLAMEGGKGGGGMLHSMSEYFGKSLPAFQAWLSNAEGLFPSLSKELRDARLQLAFCFYARQQYAEAIALYEKVEKVERVYYPYYFPRKITTLQYLIKLLALQGQGITAQFNDLVEEVAVLKKVNYGEGREDQVEDGSRVGDLIVTTIQAVVAMQQERLQRQGMGEQHFLFDSLPPL
jgi:hypothetical protein